jgi:hypothetical protein
LYKATGSESVKGAWVRVITLREIGAYRLALAVRELRSLVEDRIIDKAGVLRSIHRELRRHESQLRADAAAAEESRILDEKHRKVLDEIASVLFPDADRQVIEAVLYGVVGLCFAVDPIRVFQELVSWFEPGSSLSPTVAILFLDEGGIASRLAGSRVQVNIEGESSESSFTRILASAVAGEGTEAHLSLFLQRIFGALREFPDPFRSRLRTNFNHLLLGWCREAVEAPAALRVMAALLGSLLNARNPGLREDIFELVHGSEFERSPQLSQLARDIQIGAALS